MSRVVGTFAWKLGLETLLWPGGLEQPEHVLWMDYTSVLSWFHCEALTLNKQFLSILKTGFHTTYWPLYIFTDSNTAKLVMKLGLPLRNSFRDHMLFGVDSSESHKLPTGPAVSAPGPSTAKGHSAAKERE